MKGFASTSSKINYLWRINAEIQLVRFPDGPWFDWSYRDRRREDCCKVQTLEITLFKVTLGIEWQ